MAWDKPRNPWGCSVLVCGLPFLWSLGSDELRWGTTLAQLGQLLKCPFLREAFSDHPSNKSNPVLSPSLLYFCLFSYYHVLYSIRILFVCLFSFYLSPLIEHKQLVPSTLASRCISNHMRCRGFPLSSEPPYASVPLLLLFPSCRGTFLPFKTFTWLMRCPLLWVPCHPSELP